MYIVYIFSIIVLNIFVFYRECILVCFVCICKYVLLIVDSVIVLYRIDYLGRGELFVR